MVPFMLVETPDDRYRGQPGPSWRRVLRLLAAAVACFVVGAEVLPWIGFLFDIGACVLVLLTLCPLEPGLSPAARPEATARHARTAPRRRARRGPARRPSRRTR